MNEVVGGPLMLDVTAVTVGCVCEADVEFVEFTVVGLADFYSGGFVVEVSFPLFPVCEG